jgi:hypothetical protein
LGAALLCCLAPFSDLPGWALAIAGVLLLRRAALSRKTKWVLAAVAIAPKVLFLAAHLRSGTGGLTFPIEPRNLAASSSLWAWSVLLAAFGALLILQRRRPAQAPGGAPQGHPRRDIRLALLGLIPIAVAAVMLLGLTDGFHRIDEAGKGKWALWHAARGNVAVFSASDLASITAVENYSQRRVRNYSVKLALNDGRSFSVTTKTAAALEELRKFATTATLPAGKVRITPRRGASWTNGGSGIALRDCVGTYEPVDKSGPSRSIFDFRLEGDRLVGRETIVTPEGRRVRALRNIKVSEDGSVEFEPAAYLESSQQKAGTMSLSFGWSRGGETGRFVKNGFESGLQKYRRK